MGEKRNRELQEKINGTSRLQELKRLRRQVFTSFDDYLPNQVLGRALQRWTFAGSVAVMVGFWGVIAIMAIAYFMERRIMALEIVSYSAVLLAIFAKRQEYVLRILHDAKRKKPR